MRGGFSAASHVSRSSISAFSIELTGSADRPASAAFAASSAGGTPAMECVIGTV